jgi:hypothetical protein
VQEETHAVGKRLFRLLEIRLYALARHASSNAKSPQLAIESRRPGSEYIAEHIGVHPVECPCRGHYSEFSYSVEAGSLRYLKFLGSIRCDQLMRVVCLL